MIVIIIDDIIMMIIDDNNYDDIDENGTNKGCKRELLADVE